MNIEYFTRRDFIKRAVCLTGSIFVPPTISSCAKPEVISTEKIQQEINMLQTFLKQTYNTSTAYADTAPTLMSYLATQPEYKDTISLDQTSLVICPLNLVGELYALQVIGAHMAHFPPKLYQNIGLSPEFTVCYTSELRGDPTDSHEVKTIFSSKFALINLTSSVSVPTTETIDSLVSQGWAAMMHGHLNSFALSRNLPPLEYGLTMQLLRGQHDLDLQIRSTIANQVTALEIQRIMDTLSLASEGAFTTHHLVPHFDKDNKPSLAKLADWGLQVHVKTHLPAIHSRKIN